MPSHPDRVFFFLANFRHIKYPVSFFCAEPFVLLYYRTNSLFFDFFCKVYNFMCSFPNESFILFGRLMTISECHIPYAISSETLISFSFEFRLYTLKPCWGSGPTGTLLFFGSPHPDRVYAFIIIATFAFISKTKRKLKGPE